MTEQERIEIEQRFDELERRFHGLMRQVLETRVGLGQIAEILARMLHVDVSAAEEPEN